MKKAFLYSEDFARFDYGPSHPLKTFRLKLTYELIKACGLFDLPDAVCVEAVPASDEDILAFHDSDYITALKTANNGISLPGQGFFGLGPGDNPVFKGVYDWSKLVAGASLQAAAMVDEGEAETAFNISGGLHHAMAARASGFCYINDAVLAIRLLAGRGRRVAYIDIDAHHGDGVQEAFYSTDSVLTISIHETGRMLFPGSGFPEETGRNGGVGYSVNIPVPPYADDEILLLAFKEVVLPLIEKFRPDVVVSQLGVDSFRTDPLAHLNYTSKGFCEVVGLIKEVSPRWVALGGGGYDVANVARAWTLAWAIMNDAEAPDQIPKEFLARYSAEGFGNRRLKDREYLETGEMKERLREDIARTLDAIKTRVFPVFGL